MGVKIAGNPAAAMEKHHRRRFVVCVSVDPRRKEAGRALYLDVFRAHHRGRRHRRARRGERAERIAGALRRHVGGSRNGNSGMIWAMTGSSGVIMGGLAWICRHHRFGFALLAMMSFAGGPPIKRMRGLADSFN